VGPELHQGMDNAESPPLEDFEHQEVTFYYYFDRRIPSELRIELPLSRVVSRRAGHEDSLERLEARSWQTGLGAQSLHLYLPFSKHCMSEKGYGRMAGRPGQMV